MSADSHGLRARQLIHQLYDVPFQRGDRIRRQRHVQIVYVPIGNAIRKVRELLTVAALFKLISDRTALIPPICGF